MGMKLGRSLWGRYGGIRRRPSVWVCSRGATLESIRRGDCRGTWMRIWGGSWGASLGGQCGGVRRRPSVWAWVWAWGVTAIAWFTGWGPLLCQILIHSQTLQQNDTYLVVYMMYVWVQMGGLDQLAGGYRYRVVSIRLFMSRRRHSIKQSKCVTHSVLQVNGQLVMLSKGAAINLELLG